MASAAVSPQTFLHLAGHPLRWQLLVDLAHSDRTVRELTVGAAQPQNLVSYHLAKLRDAGIVVSRRSTADRRDSYYRVDLARLGELLAAAGGALHPGLAMSLPSVVDASSNASGPPARVLFLCTGNSARSQIAEAFARERSGGRVEARSAGSHPKPIHANAVRVMRDGYGIDLTDHRSQHLGDFADDRFDRVVSLCDRVREVCPEFPGHPEAVHWSTPDPAAAFAPGTDDDETYPAFAAVAAELETRVSFLLAALSVATAHPSDTRQEQP